LTSVENIYTHRDVEDDSEEMVRKMARRIMRSTGDLSAFYKVRW
jgi:hypothetical protein